MPASELVTALSLVQKHEGLRLKPYRCPAGKLTIGWGLNLEDRGLTRAEADYLLQSQLQELLKRMEQSFAPWWTNLSINRRAVLLDMAYNLGWQGLLDFKQTLNSVTAGDYDKAAAQMLESIWARQVKTRARELAEMMAEG